MSKFRNCIKVMNIILFMLKRQILVGGYFKYKQIFTIMSIKKLLTLKIQTSLSRLYM